MKLSVAALMLSLLTPVLSFAQVAACSSLFSDWPTRIWLEDRIGHVMASRSIPMTPIKVQKQISISAPTRNALLKEALYDTNLVEASDYSRLMSDKIFQVRYLSKVAPVSNFFPKTLELREFLDKNNLTAFLRASQESAKPLPEKAQARWEKKFLEDLQKEFPHGFVAKPAAGYDTKGKGFYINEAKGLATDLRQHPERFIGTHKGFLFASPELGVASGEAFLIQELLQARRSGVVIQGRPPEYRVHTYEGKVIQNATESRWLVEGEKQYAAVNDYVQKFLNLIPYEHLARQAWGLDVVHLGPGNFRIIEVNTNRGFQIQWSGYLISGLQLRSHVLHWESIGVFSLTGPTALTFRSGRANLEKWIEKEGRESVLEDLKINDPELAKELEKENKL